MPLIRSTAEITAASTLLPGTNSAQISVHVRDKGTGLTSNTETCSVTVSGGSASYDVSDSTTAGSSMSMRVISQAIEAAYARNFGQSLSYGATYKFSNTSSSVGSFQIFVTVEFIRGNESAALHLMEDILHINKAGVSKVEIYSGA